MPPDETKYVGRVSGLTWTVTLAVGTKPSGVAPPEESVTVRDSW